MGRRRGCFSPYPLSAEREEEGKKSARTRNRLSPKPAAASEEGKDCVRLSTLFPASEEKGGKEREKGEARLFHVMGPISGISGEEGVARCLAFLPPFIPFSEGRGRKRGGGGCSVPYVLEGGGKMAVFTLITLQSVCRGEGERNCSFTFVLRGRKPRV